MGDDIAGRVSHEIMNLADHFMHDGELTITEMMAYLQGTRHEGFLDWLLKNKYHAGADGGHYVAWVQHKDDTWVCFDDDKVTECRQVHSNATCLALPACAKFFARES